MKPSKLAIAQCRAVHLDLASSLTKLGQLVAEASQRGARLLVVGESWLSGYPAWLDHCPGVALWDNTAMKEVYSRLHANSVSVDGPVMEQICGLCRDHQIILCIGFNECVQQGPGQGTLYNAAVIIDETGTLLLHHRKLMPTFNEKLVYGFGSGEGLRAVTTSVGRLSVSICWEHWMPLTRQALHNSGEQIHLALWPTVHEMHQIASRHYAFEGRCFVLAVGQLLRLSEFPAELQPPVSPGAPDGSTDPWILSGGSCVIDPRGAYILPPVFHQEALLYCEINPEDVIRERMTLDTSGHYQRPDLFSFSVKSPQ